MRTQIAGFLRAVADRLAPPPPAPPVTQWLAPVTWNTTAAACGVPHTITYSWPGGQGGSQ